MVGFAQSQGISVVHPSTFMPGKGFPFVLEAESNGEVDRFISDELSLSLTGAQFANTTSKIKKGRAMSTVVAGSGNALSAFGPGFSFDVLANEGATFSHAGAIAGSELWAEGTIHYVTGDLEVAENDSLIIESGCWVLLDSAVNITVLGHLFANGTRQNPIVFGSNSATNYWGGISVDNGDGRFNYCFFNQGGGDESLAFGHSGSQAVLKTSDGNIAANRCFVFDCAGKGIGGSGGLMSFKSGGISRCDMGGEFLGSKITISNSHILDIPNDDGVFSDDDNDGLYLNGASAAGPSVIDSCIFMFGKDDAIDHNGAIVEVRNSWVENFENEGIASSNANSVFAYNSVFKNCEQGIEAGYGSPSVTVDHCVFVDNDYGLRFGDWYDWGCTGQIVCTNSIMWNNGNNVHNYDVLTNGPVAGAIDLTYSITNDIDYDNGVGCIMGTPNFNAQYLLEPGSPGIGIANDGTNMGLVSALYTGLSENHQQFEETLQEIRVYDLSGRLLLQANEIDLTRLRGGVYIIQEQYETYVSSYKKGVFNP